MDYLGNGSYGYVDKVYEKLPKSGSTRAVYARKSIRITREWDREDLLRSAQNEFKILNRLKHRHIVRVLDIYQFENRLSIIMLQVANGDLANYLHSVDDLESSDPLKNARKRPMQAWPGCLTQAIDYLHEMKVKHRDLKPANILIMDGRVLIADFGISKDLIDQDTTASLNNSAGAIGTKMYCAPEVLLENGRRGRAADIYSMGCVFLEISTVLLGPKGSLKKWSLHRELSGSRIYSNCSAQILQWIWYLWSLHYTHIRSCLRLKQAFDDFISEGAAPADMTFFMLDPNPKTRITARQMVDIQQSGNTHFFISIVEKSCPSCRKCQAGPDLNLTFHSIYKLGGDLNYPANPETALATEVAASWEQAKKLWLQSHMWW